MKTIIQKLLLLILLLNYALYSSAQCNTTNNPEVTNGSHIADIFTSYQGNANASPQIHYALTIAQSFTANCDGILGKIGIYKWVLKGNITRFSIYDGETISGTPVELTNVNSETAFVQDGVLSYIDLSSLNKVLVNGQKYTFLIESVDTGGSGNANTQQIAPGIASSSYPYSGGKIVSPSGWDSRDLAFKVITNSFVAPTVTTTDVSSVTKVSADFAGNATSNGGTSITEKGIVYSASDTTPEIGESGVTKDTNGTGTGVFSETIAGLQSGTTYYYRAYAINSEGTGYGVIKSFTTLGVSVTSIERETPSLEDLYENTVTYKVTFSKPVKDVNISDFTTNAAGATISTVNQISTSVYEVTVNNITANGDVFLQIKGVDGVAGSNDIATLAVAGTPNTTVNQTASDDYLNQVKIGQTYTAGINGILKKITFYPNDGNHTFSGTADLKIYAGDETNGGTEIHSESINITNSTAATGQEFIVSSTVSVVQGNTYSVVLTNFSGSGNHALNSNTTNVYANGHVIFTGMNDSSHLNFDLKIKIEEETSTLLGDLTLSNTVPTTNEKYIKITPPTLPTTETTSATSVTSTSATLSGNITHQGASAVIERGILYSTTDTNPKMGDTDVIKDTNGTGTGAFSKDITGLTANTGYFFRAYATNSQGTAYGDVKKFNFNHSLNFDGIDDRVRIQHNAATLNFFLGFTAEAWINPNQLSTQTIISQYEDNQKAFACILLASGKIEFSISLDGNTEFYFESTTSISANTWSHVAFTFDGITMKAYINGVAAGTKALGGTMFNSTAPIEIGARNDAHFFHGKIDEVRIWNIGLPEHQINSNKGISLPVHANISSLIASYNMNQGIAFGDNTSITTLTNNGANNLNGTLDNFTKTGETSNFITGVTGAFGNALNSNIFSTTGNWSNTNNWSLGIVPSQVDKAIIGSGKTVTIDVDDLKINDFTLENGAVLNIPKDKEITIQNNFTTNGSLELESDKNDSGTLLVEGSSTGNITYKRGGLVANEWYIITPPVSGQTVKTFAENAANNIRINTTPDPDRYAIATYDDSRAAGNRWVYYDANVNATDEFTAGQSYSMSRATDGEVSFTGTLSVDDLTKTLIAGQWNAIGNPFTTYYPANKNSSSSFLSENLNKLDENFPSLYIWDDTQSKYIAVTELDATNRSLPPGQGFFIKMKTGETEVLFNKDKRTTKPASGTTNFSKSEQTPEITITASKDDINVSTNIKFFENATTGFDIGYDIGNFNSTGLDIYSHLVDNSNTKNYTIQSLSNTNFDNIVIPISVNAKKGDNVTISGTFNNLPTEVKVYLEDKALNTYTELTINSKKHIVIENDGVTKNRYYIHLSKKSLNVTKSSMNDVVLYSNNNRLFIHNLKEEGSIFLYSLLGTEVFQQKIKAISKLEIPITNLAKGVYIATLKTVNGSISRKIILE